jgi:hypothetical protein
MASIFDKVKLSPAQLRSAAGRRFDDTDALRKTGENARANGVFYLGGFVIECLLKARLLERFPSMQAAKSSDGMSPQDREIFNLIYRWHDLDDMLPHLPDVESAMLRADQREGTQRLKRLKEICARWNIFARYFPRSEKMHAAVVFLDHVKEIRPWL